MEGIFESSKDGTKRRMKSRGLDGTSDPTDNGLFDPQTDLTGVILFMSFEWVKIDQVVPGI